MTRCGLRHFIRSDYGLVTLNVEILYLQPIKPTDFNGYDLRISWLARNWLDNRELVVAGIDFPNALYYLSFYLCSVTSLRNKTAIIFRKK